MSTTDSLSSQLPSVPTGELLHESRARQTLIRAVALLAIGITAIYLVWRATSTVDLGIWWLSIPLLLAEIHNAFG